MSNNLNTIFAELEQIIADRADKDPSESYVALLNKKGIDEILKKIGEESSEVIIAAKNADNKQIIYESCDLLFHLMVLLGNQDIKLDEIKLELQRRFAISGIEEKSSRTNK